MGRVCIHLKKNKVNVVLLSEKELEEMSGNKKLEKKLDELSTKYVGMVCAEIAKLELNGRQLIMAEIMVVNRLQEAMEKSLCQMYELGMLEEAKDEK